jgi:hypothetical protein
VARADDIRAELERRRLRRELEARRGDQGAAPIQADPSGTPTNAPTAQEAASTAGTAGPPALDLGADRTMADIQGMSDQFGRRGPVTVGKAALPQSVNAVMRERGMSYNDRADALIGKGIADIGHGIKQLTTGLDPEDVSDVEAWRALSEGAGMDEGEGVLNAGTVGDIAGNVGAFAVPLGAAEQTIVKATSALPKWASKIGAAMAVGGTEGALQPVLEGDFMTRGANVAVGAALPGALSGMVQAGRKAITQPFQMRGAAEALEAEGIQPTLGQGVETEGFRPFARLAKNIEENLEGILPGITSGRERAEQEVVDALARRAVPPGAPPSTHMPGSSEYFKEMDTIFDTSYKDIMATIDGTLDTAPIMGVVDDAIDNLGMMVNPATKRQMSKTFNAILSEFGGEGMTPQAARKFQEKVRKQLTKFASVENANENTTGAVEILSAINDGISDIFESRLGREGAEQLRNIDLAYANKMLIETASGFKRRGTHIPVTNLDRAVRARTGRSRRLRGEGLGQDIIDPAFETMGAPKAPRWLRALSGVGAGGAAVVAPSLAAPAIGTAMLGSTRPGARALFGLYAPQRQVKRAMDEIVEPKIGTATALIHDTEE